MQIPEVPPSFPELVKRIGAPRCLQLLKGPLRPTAGDRYRHWDRIRHLAPPHGMTREEWWYVLQVARGANRSPTPFADAAGRPFSISLCDPLLRLTSELDRDLGGRLPFDEEVVNPATRDRFLVDALIEESIRSSQLEGASTTRRIAAEMLRNGRTPITGHERMIANNFRAMRLVRERRNEPLSAGFVLDIHRAVTEGTLPDPSKAGRYRSAEDPIRVVDDATGEVLHDPPPASQLEERMGTLCAFANGAPTASFLHPIVRAVLVHFALAYDHPFTDGNGRTARALFYWSMLHQGYGLAEFLSVSQILRAAPARYARAFLYTETDAADATYFVLFHLEVIGRATRALQAYLRKRRRDLEETRRMVHHAAIFNHRQLALLGDALKDPGASYTFRSHAMSHQVVHQTARTDLLGLSQRGLLSKRKVGRQDVFHPAVDLERRLRAIAPSGGRRT